METVRLTTAQALVRFLENQYIRWDDNEQPFVKGVFLLPWTRERCRFGAGIDSGSKAP